MNLTQDYKIITSAFNSPIEQTPFTERDLPDGPHHDYTKGFIIGPFEYLVTISKDPHNPLYNMYNVEFFLQRIRKTGTELAGMLSKHLQMHMSIFDAERLNAKGLYAFHITKTGKSFRVLGNVLNIVRDFMDKYPVDCLTFDSYEESRTDLYNAMVSKLFPQAEVSEKYVKDHTEFTVCRNLKGELGKAL